MSVPQTAETSLRAVIKCPGQGRCMMAGFPGLAAGADGTPFLDPDRMGATLDAIVANGAPLLVVLTEEHELPDGSFDQLRGQAAARGLDLAFLPIRDYHTPDDPTIGRWHDLLATRQDLPNTGGTVAFTCRHGAGRSGLMATNVLLHDGMDLPDAVDLVRSHFAEAIETESQMSWLQGVSRRLKDDSQTLDVDSGTTHR